MDPTMTDSYTPDKIQIDEDRLFQELMELGKIGYVEGQGVVRPALSDADMEAGRWLERKMLDAGLEVRRDAAFNMIGALRSSARKGTPVMAVGSHLDTVEGGGMFDGALGVLAGLECVRYLREHDIDLPWDLELINFCDEEGSHYGGTFGSRAMMGLLKPDEIRQSTRSDRPSFAEDLIRCGGDPDRISEAVRDPSEFEAYLELHIEQGRVLENEDRPIGVVTGIAGIHRDLVTIVGETDHAGATPMALRDDALVKAAPLFTLLPEWVRARSEDMVGTIGRLALSPNVANAIPGKCEFVVELRSMRVQDTIHVGELVTEWVSGRKGCSVRTVERKESVDLSGALIDRISQAAEKEGLAFKKMHSGAGHDAQTLAPFLPSGMIFVPSREGKSHSPEEWTDPKHVADGCRVLVRTILELARKSIDKGYRLGDPHDMDDEG